LNILNELRERGLDLSKETHPSKPYSLHVEECSNFVKRLMQEVYGYPEDLVRFALLFSQLHDVGKLLHTWSLNQKKRPPHAIEGAEWLLRESINIDSSYRELLAYAILTHHSPLYIANEVARVLEAAERSKVGCFSSYSKCKALTAIYAPNNITGLIRKIGEDVRVDLADVIGIVKLADIISAKNLPAEDILRQYYWLESLEDKLINGVVKRAYEKRGFLINLDLRYRGK